MRLAWALVILTAASAHARADDCVRVDAGILCTEDGFNLLVEHGLRVEHERNDCLIGNRQMERDLRAAHEHIAAVEASPVVVESISWPWVAGAGLFGVLLGVLVTR